MSVGETCGNEASNIHRSSALLRPAEFEDICTSGTTGDSCFLTRGNQQSEVVEYPTSPALFLPHSEAGLLQLETLSRNQDGGCIFNFMCQGGTLLISSILPDWQNFVEDQQRGSRLCMPGNASMAISDLVSSVTGHVNGVTNSTPNRRLLLTPEPRPETASPPAGRELVLDCLAYLRQHFEMQGLSPRAAELLIETWRGNTNYAYNTAWRKWLCWCTEWDIKPNSTSVVSIMVDQFDMRLQYCTIYTLRSAISTTHPDIESSPVGSYPLVSRLLGGMFNS